MELFDELKAQIDGKNIRIVLPEGTEPRVLGAAARLQKEGILVPVLLGQPEAIKSVALENNFDIDGIEIIDVDNYPGFDEMIFNMYFFLSFFFRRNLALFPRPERS